MAEVESHPFPLDTMLFMDWRDDYTAGNRDMAVRSPAALCNTPLRGIHL